MHVKPRIRFFALVELSHMLHRLCEPPSIPLSFSLATVLPRRCTKHFRFDRERCQNPLDLVHIVYGVDYRGI